MSAVNANDNATGNGNDEDGDSATYSCVYDTTVDSSVASGTNCTSLAGAATFDTSTGVLIGHQITLLLDLMKPITADEGNLTDTEIFVITVTDTDRAPTLASISDQTINENSAISEVNANENTTGNDTDEDDTITYSSFDTSPSGAISSGANCSTLPGTVTFDTQTGVLNWSANYVAAGSYEIEITGSEGDLSDGEIFVITVNNVDRAPVIAAIGDQTTAENSAISQINISDSNTGNDNDIDGEAISYSCQFDTVVSGSISSGANCSTLPGLFS